MPAEFMPHVYTVFEIQLTITRPPPTTPYVLHTFFYLSYMLHILPISVSIILSL
jgi:hypothetical protein